MDDNRLLVLRDAPCVCHASPAGLEPGHEVVLPLEDHVGVLVHFQRLARLAVDDLDGLEEGARVALQDAVANSVLNVGPFKEVGEERLDRFGCPIRSALAAAPGLGPPLLEAAPTCLYIQKPSWPHPPRAFGAQDRDHVVRVVWPSWPTEVRFLREIYATPRPGSRPRSAARADAGRPVIRRRYRRRGDLQAGARAARRPRGRRRLAARPLASLARSGGLRHG
jgi:hypothetical protein